ncbi:MAG: DUF3109 family protein [Bacteroidia bacterium]|nr:DUF3109 family protein [Bacteroidia bacterium]
MIAIGNTLVSEDLLEKKFVCDLNACKGACCVKGDFGAPLEKDELPVLNDIFDKVKPFLSERGIKAIEKQGKYVRFEKDEWVTPLVEGKECAYTVFENGIAKCGIEKANQAGIIDFRKPVSCHLYPVRITRKKGFDAVNYDKWSVCNAACKLGEELKVPVYKFLETSLVRKYGQEWYDQLCEASLLIDKK